MKNQISKLEKQVRLVSTVTKLMCVSHSCLGKNSDLDNESALMEKILPGYSSRGKIGERCRFDVAESAVRW